jgi:hypothetical protein
MLKRVGFRPSRSRRGDSIARFCCAGADGSARAGSALLPIYNHPRP